MDSGESSCNVTPAVAAARASKGQRQPKPGNINVNSKNEGKGKRAVKVPVRLLQTREVIAREQQAAIENAASTPKKFVDQHKKRGVCNLWMAGSCKYGDRCKYKHDSQIPYPGQRGVSLDRQQGQNTGNSTTIANSHPNVGDTRINNSREWRHRQKRQPEIDLEVVRLKQEREQAEKDAERKRHRERMQARRVEEAEVVEQYVVSETSLVTCGAGLNIQRVIPGFDLCRITIKNLPGDTKPNEVSDLFTQQGVDIFSFFIMDIRPTGRKKEATVLTKADQGEAIALGLEGIEFREEVLSFESSANASWGSMRSNSGQDGPSLFISFWMPSEVNIVTYNSSDQAVQQASRLNSKIWNNRRLRASLNTKPTGPAARYFMPHSIVIHGCQPGSAIDSGFQAFVQSVNIRTSRSHTYNPNEALKNVKKTVGRFAGVKMNTFEVLNDGSKIDGSVRIKVHFDEWEQAKGACNIIGKGRAIDEQGCHVALQCRLQEPFEYSITIPRQQYEVQKRQWDNLSVKSPGSDTHVSIRIGDRGAVFIKVVGKDRKATGLLKVRAEGLLAGEKLDSTTHWHPSFMTQRGRDIFDSLPDTLQVFVRNDFKSKSLRVYGDRERIEEAKRLIKNQVDNLAKMETTRVLSRECIRGFMREGLGKLKELLGEGNVEVILTNMPYKVKVKGGVEATHHLDRIIAESRQTAPDNVQLSKTDNEVCPICFDDVSNPEELACGHKYCAACFRHFLSSASDSKNFPLVCVGNQAQCKASISIPSIRRFLPANAFQNLVEAAFTTYLENHPQELKYCTTPDCRQIYRRRADKEMLQCPSCFAIVCSLCNEGHEGITCEERKLAKQERLNEELARVQGFKKCPECGIFIEKTDGCNHITCRCGVHICWKCVKVYPKETIYTHLRSAHGGISDDLPGEMNNENIGDEAFLAMQVQEIHRLERIQALRHHNVAQPNPIRVNQELRPGGVQPAIGLERQGRGLNVGAPRHAMQEEIDQRMRWLEQARFRAIGREEEQRQQRQQERVRAILAREEEQRRLREREQAEIRRRQRQQEQGGWCILM